MIRTAIIGCGAISQTHLHAIQKIGKAEIIACCDINSERACKFAAQSGGKPYTDYKDMIIQMKPDIVHICTPHYLHVPMASFAVTSGCDVVMEKPAGLTAEEAEDLAETCKNTSQRAIVCFQNRYNPSTLAVQEIINEGTLGRIIGTKAIVTWCRREKYYTESGWRGKMDTEGGGVLINQSIHTLDLMQYLAGKVDSVKANIDRRLLGDYNDVEDTADMTLFFESGATGVFYATVCHTSDSPIELEINMEKGTLLIKDNKAYIVKDGKYEVIANDFPPDNPEKAYWGASHKELIERFYNGFEKRLPSEIDITEGLKVSKIIDAARKSSEIRSGVDIE